MCIQCAQESKVILSRQTSLQNEVALVVIKRCCERQRTERELERIVKFEDKKQTKEISQETLEKETVPD